VTAINRGAHTLGYFPPRFDVNLPHSNMGSRFAFCSSQESFCL
jgi:hypothetical protein